MTEMPAEMAIRPKLNTADWISPRDQAGGPEPEELSPPSPGRETAEYTWEEQKESRGHADVDEQPAPININIPPLVSRPRDSMGGMPSDMLQELRKIIKEEGKFFLDGYE